MSNVRKSGDETLPRIALQAKLLMARGFKVVLLARGRFSRSGKTPHGVKDATDNFQLFPKLTGDRTRLGCRELVRYRLSDLLAFLENDVRHSTSERD